MLLPVSLLICLVVADMYRGLFKFGVFNAVQSQCYDTVRSPVAFHPNETEKAVGHEHGRKHGVFLRLPIDHI